MEHSPALRMALPPVSAPGGYLGSSTLSME
jgi:hypothetical protein